MKNLLSLLLIPFLSVSASKLDIDATDYRADENLVLDILLNSESIDVLENLASPLAPLAASNSVFTRLREGKSIPELKSSISSAPDSMPYNESGSKAYRLIQRAKEPRQVQQKFRSQPHKYPSHQANHQSIIYPQVPCYQPTALIIIPPLAIYQDAVTVFYPVCAEPCIQKPRYPAIPTEPRHEGFNLHHCDSEGRPGTFIANISNLNCLPRAINNYSMFNQNSSYFLFSNVFSSRELIRNCLSKSLVFSINLNPQNTTRVCFQIRDILQANEIFSRAILAIFLNFTNDDANFTMTFALKDHYKFLAHDLRSLFLGFCSATNFGYWH